MGGPIAYSVVRAQAAIQFPSASDSLSSYMVLALGLCSASLLGALVPAWRACRVEPAIALKAE